MRMEGQQLATTKETVAVAHRQVLPGSDLDIVRVVNLVEVMQIIPFERQIRRKGRDRSREADMLLFIKGMLGNPLFGLWMAYNERKEMVGYTIALIAMIPGFERETILRMYAKDEEVRERLLDILFQWAKAFRIKTQAITVTRNVKAIHRKYKFVPVSVNMERRI